LGPFVTDLELGEAVSDPAPVDHHLALTACAVLGAVVVKLVAARSRRAPGWFLPLAGGLLFTLLVGVVLTSAVWYVATVGWPL